MDIRLANNGDIPDLLRLLKQVGQVHHELRPDIFPEGTLKYDAEALAQLLTDETRPVFVAAAESAVVGYCFCVRKQFGGSCATSREELYIDDLCVEETCRGGGIATALYRHAVAHARSLGCHSVTLNVWCGNDAAMSFYEKQGLKPRNMMMEMRLGEPEC